MKLLNARRVFTALLLSLCVSYAIPFAATQDERLGLILKISDIKSIPAHQGLKVAHFYKNGKNYFSKNEIKYLNMTHFEFKTLEPDKYAGNVIAADGENFLMYMPHFRTRLKTKLRTDIRIEKGMETLHLNIDASSLAKNYAVTYLGAAKISGQDTLVFQIKGKIQPFAQKLWVAKQKPLILQEERSYNGKKYYDFTYVKISFSAPKEKELVPDIPLTAFPLPANSDIAFYDSMEQARQNVKNMPIPVLKKLPKGYLFSHVEVMKSPLGEVVSSLYTDGVSGIRVGERKEGGFVEGMMKFFGLNMKEIQDDIQNYSPMNFYEVKKGNEFLALSGELPREILKKFMPYFSEVSKSQ